MKRLLPPRAVRVAAALLVAAGLCVVVGSASPSIAAAASSATLALNPAVATAQIVNGQYVVHFTATYTYVPGTGQHCNGFDTVLQGPGVPGVNVAAAHFNLGVSCVATVSVQLTAPKSEAIYRLSAGTSTNPQFPTEIATATIQILAPASSPTPKPSPTVTPKPSATATPKPSATATPTLKPSPTATVKPTIAPTLPPVEPTAEETPTPTAPPTPTAAPSSAAPQTPPASPAIGTPKPDASSESDAQSTSNRQPSSPLPILIVSPIVIGGLGWLIFVAVRRLENS